MTTTAVLDRCALVERAFAGHFLIRLLVVVSCPMLCLLWSAFSPREATGMSELTDEFQGTEEIALNRSPANAKLSEYRLLVDTPRPMADMARIIGSRFGEPVTYEDPPFKYREELRPLRTGIPGDVPRNIYESVSYPASADMGDVVSAATVAHNAQEAGGRFVVRHIAGVWGLVPSHCRGNEGRVAPHRSFLDEPVTIELPAECSCAVALESVVAEIARGHLDVSVNLGRFPKEPLSRLSFPQENVATTGREVLNQILKVANARLSGSGSFLTWQFRYSPGSSRNQEMWILEFQRIERRTAKSYLLCVESVRPIASAIDIIQRHFPVSISYEEPSLSCSCDLLGNLGDGSASLAGGVINVEWAEEQHAAAEVLEFITLAPIEPRDPAGMFGVEQINQNRFHVFPTKRRDVAGKLISAKSLLAKEISTDGLRGSVAEVAGECAARALGVKKVMWDVDSESVAKALSIPASRQFTSRSMPARAAIDNVLGSISAPLSWQLRFDPSSATHRLYFYSSASR